MTVDGDKGNVSGPNKAPSISLSPETKASLEGLTTDHTRLPPLPKLPPKPPVTKLQREPAAEDTNTPEAYAEIEAQLLAMEANHEKISLGALDGCLRDIHDLKGGIKDPKKASLLARWNKLQIKFRDAGGFERAKIHPQPSSTGILKAWNTVTSWFAGRGKSETLGTLILSALRKCGDLFRKKDIESTRTEAPSTSDSAKKTESVAADRFDKRTLITKWKDGKKTLLTEKAERIDTIAQAKKNALAHIRYLRGRGNPREEELVKRYKDIIAACDEAALSGKTWVTSDDYRSALRGLPDIRPQPGETTVRRQIDAWASAQESYYTQPAPVNMRYHECAVQDTPALTKGWLRLGVISDKSNGFINYEQLKKLQEKIKTGPPVEAIAIRNAMAREVVQAWMQARSEGNETANASAGYALRQLGFSDEQIESIFKVIKENRMVSFLMFDPRNSEEFSAKIQETVELREHLLQQQFLQVVQEHMTRAGELKGEFRMAHVGLLNHNSKSVDESGWYHNEENEMLDMAAIFAQFDGKKIIFGKSGPCIDEEGNILLPASEKRPAGEITLRALFVNQSVQGYTINDGTQKKLNERAQEKLAKMQGVPKAITSGILDAEESSYSSAADMIDVFKQLGFHVSTGCESAKDRTGGVSAVESIMRVGQQAGIAAEKLQQFMRAQLEPEAIGPQIVKENTDLEIMKIAPYKIEGVTDAIEGGIAEHVKGISQRIKIFATQGFGILAERRKIAKENAPGRRRIIRAAARETAAAA